MGTTCASVHIVCRGNADVAVKAISRSYTKLGYERAKAPPAEGGKHVILLAPAGQSYVSVYDSDNAHLDSGELKDLALLASKALKSAAVFTSLYDSDTYEFIVFANGRQVDLLMTDAESYEGPLMRLSDKARATKWSSLFGRTLTMEQIKQTVASPTTFADNIVAGLSGLVGLDAGQAQLSYQDVRVEGEKTATHVYFKKKPLAIPAAAAGEIRLADYFDPDNCRMRSVYPASWPIAVGSKRLATWLLLSQGVGFGGGTATIHRSGPDSLLLSNAIITGCKFHNGQIVGPLEPIAPNLTQEDVEKVVEDKRFKLLPVESASLQSGLYHGEFPHLIIPPMTAGRTTQILIILQVEMEPQAAGEWEIDVSIQPGTQTAYQHRLPPVRLAAVEQTWIPVVSGLNPKTTYDTSNLSATHLRELSYQQTEIPKQRQLDHPAITSTVAILEDEGQATLDACKAWLETWLRPLTNRTEGEIRIHAEKHMSESCYVGKTKKNLPVSGCLDDNVWSKLFDGGNNYQTILASVVAPGAECALAGIGLQNSLREYATTALGYTDKHVTDTLRAMRNRPFEVRPLGATWHLFKWVINHQDCYGYLATSARAMEEQLDRFAAEHRPLQAWSGQCTWIPVFDQAGGYKLTVYEEASVLNWFRGILGNDGGMHTEKITAQWCRNVVRMVTPNMWLCRSLIDQVNRVELEKVAEVREAEHTYKITLRRGCTLDELELALLPILPVESARLSLSSRR